MIELDDDCNYNYKNRMDKQKYNTKVTMDLAAAKQLVAERSRESAPVTFEPPHTPCIDMDEQMMFQDEFMLAI